MEQLTAPTPSWLSVETLLVPVARRAIGRLLTLAVVRLLAWGVLESKEAELLIDIGSYLLTELIWHQVETQVIQPFLRRIRIQEAENEKTEN